MKLNIIKLAIIEAKIGMHQNLENAQSMLLKHLESHPKDTDAWLLVTRIECGKSVEYADKIKYFAEKILGYDPKNPYALLFLAYAEYYLQGCSDNNLIKKLDNAKSNNQRILSMIELAKAFYWQNRDLQEYETALKRSIKHYKKDVKNYYMLGKFYIDQGKNIEGRKLMNMGLSNIKGEVTIENFDEPYDPTNIPHFLAEFFSGTRTNFLVHKILLEELNAQEEKNKNNN